MSKKCADCKWFNKIVGIHCTWHEIEMHPNEEACGDFEPPTVFDKITESVETLAEQLVFNYYFEDCHYRTRAWKSFFFLHNRYKTKAEAIAATIEELKKEWKK